MQSSEPEFRAWRRRLFKRSLIFGLIGIPVGFLFVTRDPWITLIVSGLAAMCALVSFLKLRSLPS